MAVRLDRFRNALGALLGLVVGFIAVNPVALKAIAMLPVISMLTPAQDQEVSGSVTFYATADAEGVASLQFQVDGQNVGSQITAGSCRAAWDSTQAADGLHSVRAIGRDEFNNEVTSQPVTVRVNNFVPPPTPTPTPTPPPAPPAPPAPPVTPPQPVSVTILSPSANARMQGIAPVFVAIPAQASTVSVQLKNAWGETVNKWSIDVVPSGSASTVQVNTVFDSLPAANYSLTAMAVVSGVAVVSDPVQVRVENTSAPPPPAPPAPPAGTPPSTPAPPAPPSNNSPVPTVTILSPSPNAPVQGIVPVFVAIPAQASTVSVQLKNAWGETVNKWAVVLAPSGSAITVQINAVLDSLPAASYSLTAMAIIDGLAVMSEPVPVRVENTAVPPPSVAPPQTPVPPQTPAPGSPRPTPSSGGSTAPSRIKSPTLGEDPSLATGAAGPRPETQPAAGERATVRSSTSVASHSKAGSKSLTASGSGSQTQKSTAPATPKSTSLPAGRVITLSLGPCSGPDPYAKHATLKGECVSGTWFPRVRKAEPRRPE